MVTYLDWDSYFFKLRIAKAIITTDSDMDELISQQGYLSDNYDLIYVFSSPEVLAPMDNCSLVDQKVVYNIDLPSSCTGNEANIIEYNNDFVSEDLRKLALESGEFSRFRLDERFPTGSYERLYTHWIEQSVNHINATEVFCYMIDGLPKGLLTLNRNVIPGEIGLVATDSLSRCLGIGSALLSFVKSFCSQKGMKSLSVATQRQNTPACHMYEKAGFIEDHCSNVWHWWLH